MNCIKEQLLQIQEKLNDLMDSDASQEEAVFRVYQMDYPDYEFYDTLAASRRAFRYLENHQLHTVAAECGYCLDNHHHALADAEACAKFCEFWQNVWRIEEKNVNLQKQSR